MGPLDGGDEKGPSIDHFSTGDRFRKKRSQKGDGFDGPGKGGKENSSHRAKALLQESKEKRKAGGKGGGEIRSPPQRRREAISISLVTAY